MSFSTLLSQAVTLTTVADGSRDAYGRTTHTTTTQTVNGRIDQIQTTERIGDRDVTTTRYTLFLEPSVVIGPEDRVAIDGITYQVDGDPWPVMGARTVHHLEVPLRRVDA